MVTGLITTPHALVIALTINAPGRKPCFVKVYESDLRHPENVSQNY
jgi:hypothetical protein